jgi:phosphatidylserine/phosphatidylglycerophosphate/cardiolipin synthase-like enzyme
MDLGLKFTTLAGNHFRFARKPLHRFLAGMLPLLFLLVLTACHRSPAFLKQVDQTVQVQKGQQRSCDEADPRHCALDTPLESLWQASQRDGKNRVVLLEKGTDALLARIHLIKAAQRRIDIQTFIWVDDEAGHLVLQELLAAAKRGVQVNIIIDQLFSMDNTWFLAELATLHQNLHIKVFNPVFREAHTSKFDFFSALACCLSSLNRRMHNKLFLVDGRYGITGGRNYQDRYFDWDPAFDYRDRDALVIGPVAGQMRESFNEFWQHPYSVALEHLDDVSQRILDGKHNDSEWFTPFAPHARQLVMQAFDDLLVEDKFVATAMVADKVEYFSDSPDKVVHSRSGKQANKALSGKIRDLILTAEREVIMQTPYLVLSRKAYRALKKLRHRHPAIRLLVSTNSLASTDAFYVYAISFKHKRRYLKRLGLLIYEYKPKPAYWREMFASPVVNENTRFGLHAKSFVIDEQLSLIGSHNFDHRSDTLNTEAGLIIESPQVARALKAWIKRDTDPENSWVVAAKQDVPVWSAISGLIASVSRALPVFDVWPFRYSSSYELLSPYPAVEPGHPDFYRNYREVGSFPAVDLSSKQIQTIIISAFAGFAEPVM